MSSSTRRDAEPPVGDRLHLSQGDQLGWFYLSTILDDLSRYHHHLEAVHDDDSRGCDGDTGMGTQGIRLREHPGRTSARLLSDKSAS